MLGKFLTIRETQTDHCSAKNGAPRLGIIGVFASRFSNFAPPCHLLPHLAGQSVEPFEICLLCQTGELRNVGCNQPVGQSQVNFFILSAKQLFQLTLRICAWRKLAKSAFPGWNFSPGARTLTCGGSIGRLGRPDAPATPRKRERADCNTQQADSREQPAHSPRFLLCSLRAPSGA